MYKLFYAQQYSNSNFLPTINLILLVETSKKDGTSKKKVPDIAIFPLHKMNLTTYDLVPLLEDTRVLLYLLRCLCAHRSHISLFSHGQKYRSLHPYMCVCYFHPLGPKTTNLQI